MIYPKRSKTVHVEILNDELCLYDWQRKEVHALNPTAALVWRMCDGQTSPAQMTGQLKGDLTPAQAEALVWASLEQLREAHLLEGEIARPDGRSVLTRRQVLKVLGGAAAGAVLMPVVSSIVAPTPVEAQSPRGEPPNAVDDIIEVSPIAIQTSILENDDLGTPAATLISFGGGSLGGSVTDNAAGASVPLGGGTLTVDAGGNITLAGLEPGTYTFQYRIANSAGTSDATVTMYVGGD